MIDRPIYIYNNWSAYDELSDNIELTEGLAMRQFAEVQRLRSAGVRIDGYLMDAFWYEPDGGYRKWRQPHWPEGPDRWLDACISEGIKPGLWLSGNTLVKLEPDPAWVESLDMEKKAMCMFHGGFLSHLLETIELWYQRGVRIFKFDFMQFKAAPSTLQRSLLPSEIYAQNVAALRTGLQNLRSRCGEIILIGYNGFDEIETMTNTDLPFRKTTDLRWLEVFDSMYCGDPRPSDVPAINFWRSVDIYSDHMVRYYESMGFPLSRIDSCSFMIGATGTCYQRKTSAWQGMLVLSLARGGWVNTYHGNLELLDDIQVRWFAKVQLLFDKFLAYGRISSFGGIPGLGQIYGFWASRPDGAVYTVVNPTQQENQITLPNALEGRILFCDSGFQPILDGGCLTLGPEQLTVVGTGYYNNPIFDLGVQSDINIPLKINPLHIDFTVENGKLITATLPPGVQNTIRIIIQQKNDQGFAKRSYASDGNTLDRILNISAEQDQSPVDITINYGKTIWSGLSWASGEISPTDLDPEIPLTLRMETYEQSKVRLNGTIFQVDYTENG